MDDVETAWLLGRCAAGDRGALRGLYDALAPRLLGIALRLLHDRSAAEEAVQDAFLQIWHNAAGFDRSRGAPLAWMTGILRYRALDRLSAERRHHRPDDLDPEQAEAYRLLDGVAPGADETSLSLDRCLGELKDSARQCILMAYVEGYSHGEIAERLGHPDGTVKSWINRGLQSLKRCLEQ